MSATSRAPVISVVIATYNAAEALPGCLDSVLAQDHPAVDAVVIDGASTDGTVDVLKAYAGRLGHWLSEPDTGVYGAWNKALRHVQGDWVCFLGADDRFAAPSALSAMSPHLAERSERVIYGVTNVVNDDGQVVLAMGRPWPETRAQLGDQMSLPNPSTFYRRDLFRSYGTFDESFRIAGDYDFLLRELVTRPAAFVDILVVNMGAGGVSQDLRNRAASLKEAERARRQNGLTERRYRHALEILEADIFLALHRRAGIRRTGRDWALYQAFLRPFRRGKSALRAGTSAIVRGARPRA